MGGGERHRARREKNKGSGWRQEFIHIHTIRKIVWNNGMAHTHTCRWSKRVATQWAFHTGGPQGSTFTRGIRIWLLAVLDVTIIITSPPLTSQQHVHDQNGLRSLVQDTWKRDVILTSERWCKRGDEINSGLVGLLSLWSTTKRVCPWCCIADALEIRKK